MSKRTNIRLKPKNMESATRLAEEDGFFFASSSEGKNTANQMDKQIKEQASKVAVVYAREHRERHEKEVKETLKAVQASNMPKQQKQFLAYNLKAHSAELQGKRMVKWKVRAEYKRRQHMKKKDAAHNMPPSNKPSQNRGIELRPQVSIR